MASSSNFLNSSMKKKNFVLKSKFKESPTRSNSLDSNDSVMSNTTVHENLRLKISYAKANVKNEDTDLTLFNDRRSSIKENIQQSYTSKKQEYDFFTCNNVNKSSKMSQRNETVEAPMSKKTKAADFLNSNNSTQTLTKLIMEKCKKQDTTHLFWDNTRRAVTQPDFDNQTQLENDVKMPMAVRSTFVKKLEARLSQDDDAWKWLDSNGRFAFTSDPFSEEFTKPFFSNSDYQHLTKFVAPIKHSKETRLLQDIGSSVVPILELKLRSLHLLYHPLFSIEHILVKKLIALHDQYKSALLQKKQDKLDETLDILRKTRTNVIFKMSREDIENTKIIYKSNSIRKYYKKIADTRKKRIEEAKHIKILQKNILFLWKDIKNFRKRNGAVSTPVILEIRKKTVNKEEDEKYWEGQFKLELLDVIAELECEYINQKIEYKKQIKIYKETASSGEKPVKPRLECDEDSIKERISEEMREAFRQPGEPIIELNLKYSNEILTYLVKTAYEISRRTKVSNLKSFLRILIDGVEICRTNCLDFNESFTCDIGEEFSINAESLNDFITVELADDDNVICSADIALPSNVALIDDVQLSTLRLVEITNSAKKFKNLLKCSGLTFYSYDLFSDNILTEALMYYKIGWSIPPSHKTEKYRSISEEEYIKSKVYNQVTYGQIDVCLLRRWAQKYLSEDQTMKKVILCKLSEFEEFENSGTLSCTFEESLSLDKEHLKNARFKLLLQRNQSDTIKSKLRMVPLLTSEITMNMIDLFSDEPSILNEYSNLSTLMNPVDLQRRYGLKYIEHINKYIHMRNRQRNCGKQMKDVVIGYQVPDLKSFCTLEFLRPKRPLYPDKKGNTDALNLSHFNDEYQLIVSVVRAFQLPSRVDMSTNIYNRGDMGSSHAAFKIINMHPYVRVSCQNRTMRTSTASGLSPTWNQQLIIPVKNDISSEIIVSLYDEIREELSPETDKEPSSSRTASLIHHYRLSGRWLAELRIPFSTVAKITKMDGTYKMFSPPTLLGYKYTPERNASQIMENTNSIHVFEKEDIFLTMYIAIQPAPPRDPLSITTNLSVEPGEMNYIDKHVKNMESMYPDREFSMMFIDTSGKTKLMTRFFHPLPIPDIDLAEKKSERVGSGFSASSSTSRRIASKPGLRSPQKGGEKETYSLSSHRKAVDSIELRSLSGEHSHSTERLMQACAKYVSLIPMYDKKDDNIITVTGRELLKLLCGTDVDHAILLTCYFMELGVSCWLVSGFGTPNGASAFVLFRTNAYTNRLSVVSDNIKTNTSGTFLGRLGKDFWNYYIYDVTTGIKYDVRDPFCPLQKVYYVCNHENVWINNQVAERSDVLHFDFEKTSDWRPLFDKKTPAPPPGGLSDLDRSEIYKAPVNVNALKVKIEDRIKIKIQKWRSHHKTNWNRYCSAVLRDSLQDWEYWTFNPSQIKPESNQHLLQLLSSYEMYGFPLNMPYSNLKAIISAVKATGIYVNECVGLEFALAVELFCYPNSVISVWVYIASLLKK